MTAELGVGFALRAVNERVQQSVARRPRVRTGRRGLGRAEKGDTCVGLGVTVTQKGLARFPRRSGLEDQDFLEGSLVGERCSLVSMCLVMRHCPSPRY